MALNVKLCAFIFFFNESYEKFRVLGEILVSLTFSSDNCFQFVEMVTERTIRVSQSMSAWSEILPSKV